MPLLPGGLVIADPSVLPVVTTPPPVWYEDAGTMTATWIDPTGAEWPLSNTNEDLGWFTTKGPAGVDAAPVEIVTDQLGTGGEQVRFITRKPRRIQWPIYIGGRTRVEYKQRKRQITRAFTMTTQRLAHGWLKIAEPDSSARLIAAYYEQGLEGEADDENLFSKPVIQLYCPDGYWWAPESIPVEQQFYGTPESTFFDPYMTVGSSRIISGGSEDPAVTVLNPGDVEAWPTWLITGPMQSVTAENFTALGRFTLTYDLAAGQQIRITTNRPTVRGPGDTNLADKIDWFAELGTFLWPLVDGPNDIHFEVAGAADGTAVRMEFTPRYETS